jgi:hypothetical protein
MTSVSPPPVSADNEATPPASAKLSGSSDTSPNVLVDGGSVMPVYDVHVQSNRPDNTDAETPDASNAPPSATAWLASEKEKSRTFPPNVVETGKLSPNGAKKK